jgi:hypothetical protein
MEKLLAEPAIAARVEKMTTLEFEYYKSLLVKQGTLKRYILEQQAKQVKDEVNKNFPGLVKEE